MSNLRISSFGAPKNSPPPAPPAPPAPPPASDHSADLAELAQWRAAFPNQSPQQVRDSMQVMVDMLNGPHKSKPKTAPKKKKAKK